MDIKAAKEWLKLSQDSDRFNANWRIRETRADKTVAYYTPTADGYMVDFPRI